MGNEESKEADQSQPDSPLSESMGKQSRFSGRTFVADSENEGEAELTELEAELTRAMGESTSSQTADSVDSSDAAVIESKKRGPNPWHTVRKVRPSLRRRPLAVGKTRSNGAITLAVVSRLEDVNGGLAEAILCSMRSLLMTRYQNQELPHRTDWRHVAQAFRPFLNTRKTLVYMHFEKFFRDKCAGQPNLQRNLVLCGRGLPEEMEETGLTLPRFVHGYAQHMKREWVIRRGDELYLVLYLFAQDIFIRNVHPIWYRWPEDVSYEKELMSDSIDGADDGSPDYRSLLQESEAQEVVTDMNGIWSARVKHAPPEPAKNAHLRLMDRDDNAADEEALRAVQIIQSAYGHVTGDGYDDEDDHDRLDDQDDSHDDDEDYTDYTDDQITVANDPADSEYMPSNVSSRIFKHVKPEFEWGKSRNSDSMENQPTDSLPSTRGKAARRLESHASLSSDDKEDRGSSSFEEPLHQNNLASQLSHEHQTSEGDEEVSKHDQAVTKPSGFDKEDKLISDLRSDSKDSWGGRMMLRPGDYSGYIKSQQDLLVYSVEECTAPRKTKFRKGAAILIESSSSEDEASVPKRLRVATDEQQRPENHLAALVKTKRSVEQATKPDSSSAVSTVGAGEVEDPSQSKSRQRPDMAEKYLRRYKKGQALSTKVLRNKGKPTRLTKLVQQPVVEPNSSTSTVGQNDRHERSVDTAKLQKRASHVSVQAGRQKRKSSAELSLEAMMFPESTQQEPSTRTKHVVETIRPFSPSNIQMPEKAHSSGVDLIRNAIARHNPRNGEGVVSTNTPTSPPKQMQTPPRSDNELPQDATLKSYTTGEQSDTSAHIKDTKGNIKRISAAEYFARKREESRRKDDL